MFCDVDHATVSLNHGATPSPALPHPPSPEGGLRRTSAEEGALIAPDAAQNDDCEKTHSAPARSQVVTKM